MKTILVKSCILIILIFVIGPSCSSGKFSEKELEIDESFKAVFNSITNDKQINFSNGAREKHFVFSGIDSLIRNSKGGFMGGGSYKEVFVSINEVGTDTLHLERSNRILVYRNPEENYSGISISFCNFRYFEEKLPIINIDTTIGDKSLENYYLFQTDLQSKQPDDVVELFVTLDEGIVAFKTICGEYWFRKGETK